MAVYKVRRFVFLLDTTDQIKKMQKNLVMSEKIRTFAPEFQIIADYDQKKKTRKSCLFIRNRARIASERQAVV